MITALNPYLNFDGNTEEAFNFYKSVFGGEFATFQRFKDVPGQDVEADEQNRIMHVALPLSGNMVLMGSDTSRKHSTLTTGNQMYISISTDTDANADKIYNGLSAGGKALMPMTKMFWGAYFGMCIDKFGIQWMISCEPKR